MSTAPTTVGDLEPYQMPQPGADGNVALVSGLPRGYWRQTPSAGRRTPRRTPRRTASTCAPAGVVGATIAAGAVVVFSILARIPDRLLQASEVVNTIALRGSFNGSAISITVTETDYDAAGLRVPVLTRTHLAGTAIGLPITTDRTDTLESATPS